MMLVYSLMKHDVRNVILSCFYIQIYPGFTASCTNSTESILDSFNLFYIILCEFLCYRTVQLYKLAILVEFSVSIIKCNLIYQSFQLYVLHSANLAVCIPVMSSFDMFLFCYVFR